MKPILFHPSIHARALDQADMYDVTATGQTENILMLQVARRKAVWVGLKDGEVYDQPMPNTIKKAMADPDHTYEVHCDLVDGREGLVFVPFVCNCMDATCRKHMCKHVAISCLTLSLEIAPGYIDDSAEVTEVS